MKNLLLPVLMLGFLPILFAQDGEFHLNQEYQIKNNGVINLECSDAIVFITGSGKSGIASVKIDRKITTKGWNSGDNDFKVEIETEGGNLNIQEHNAGSGFSFVGYHQEEYKIEIKAPDGVSITVRGDDGDYYIKNINGAISMRVDDADIELSGCKGNSFDFQIDDGDITMDEGKGTLEIDADDSDVQIFNAHFTGIEADMDDGDLLIETSLQDKGDYRINAQDGSVAIEVTGGGGEFDIRHDDTHVVTAGPFESLHESEEHTKLSLKKGSARISLRADDARVKLTARN